MLISFKNLGQCMDDCPKTKSLLCRDKPAHKILQGSEVMAPITSTEISLPSFFDLINQAKTITFCLIYKNFQILHVLQGKVL